jgi:hypothetical protein
MITVTRTESATGRVAYNVTKEPVVAPPPAAKTYTVTAPWISGPALMDEHPDGALVVTHNNDDPAILCVIGETTDRQIPQGNHEIVVSDGTMSVTYKLVYNGKNNLFLQEKKEK